VVSVYWTGEVVVNTDRDVANVLDVTAVIVVTVVDKTDELVGVTNTVVVVVELARAGVTVVTRIDAQSFYP